MKSRSKRMIVPVLALAVLGLAASGCEGLGKPKEDPVAVHAAQVLREVMGQNPQYAEYGLQVVARSTAPLADEMIRHYLTSGTYQTQTAAVRAVGRRGDTAATETLQTLFQQRHGLLKLESAAALAKMGDAAALEWLKGQVTDERGTVNPEGVRALARLGHGDVAKPALEPLVDHKDQQVRDLTYALLGDLKEPWAVELLKKGFKKERGETRREAIVAMGRSGDPSLAEVIWPFVETQGVALEAMEAIGNLGNKAAIPHLERAFRNFKQPVARIYAGAALWKLGEGAKVKAQIGPFVGDGDAFLRLKMAEQLAGVRSGDVLDLLAALANDSEAQVRIAAMRALREWNEPGLEEILIDRASDSDYRVASLALDALGTMGSSMSIPTLEPLLQHENPYVAISAANAILEIRHREPASGQAS